MFLGYLDLLLFLQKFCKLQTTAPVSTGVGIHVYALDDDFFVGKLRQHDRICKIMCQLAKTRRERVGALTLMVIAMDASASLCSCQKKTSK